MMATRSQADEKGSQASFGAALAGMRSLFPDALFGGAHWRRLLDRAASLPAGTMEHSFGFEIRLGSPEPAADFCVVAAPGGELAAWIAGGRETGAAANGSPTPEAALTACLREIAAPGAFANRAVKDALTMLEYDVVAVPAHRSPPPGVFWSLNPGVGAGDSAAVSRLLALAAGAAAPDACAAEQVRAVFNAVAPYGRISQVGTFVGRQPPVARLLVSRVEPERLAPLLGALRWPGAVGEAARLAQTLVREGVRLGVALDATAEGLGPRLGLELYQPGRSWIDSRHADWRTLIDTLVRKGWCRSNKALGLERWCGPKRLFAGRELFFLARGINHVKVGIRAGNVEAKAYLGANRLRARDPVDA